LIGQLVEWLNGNTQTAQTQTCSTTNRETGSTGQTGKPAQPANRPTVKNSAGIKQSGLTKSSLFCPGGSREKFSRRRFLGFGSSRKGVVFMDIYDRRQKM